MFLRIQNILNRFDDGWFINETEMSEYLLDIEQHYFNQIRLEKQLGLIK